MQGIKQGLSLWLPDQRGLAGGAVAGNGLLSITTAYWKMDENVASGSRADATGNGWTATDPNANVGNTASGLINRGLNITNAAMYLSVSASIDTRANSAPFAMQLWINPIAFTNNYGYAGEFAGSFLDWLIYTNGAGALNVQGRDGLGNQTILGAGILNASAWNHVVAGFDGVNLVAYVNNVKSTLALSGGQSGVIRGRTPLTLCNYNTITTGVAGLYDEVVYFSAMPTATQVGLLNNGGAGLPFASFTA